MENLVQNYDTLKTLQVTQTEESRLSLDNASLMTSLTWNKN